MKIKTRFTCPRVEMPRSRASQLRFVSPWGKNLGRLSLDQLEELKKIVHMLSLVKEKEKQEEVKAEKRRERMINESFKQAREGQEVQIGYIEEKMINGFGPYLYFRYHDSGVHKSLYIGKKE